MSTWSVLIDGNTRAVRRVLDQLQSHEGVDITVFRKRRRGPWVIWKDKGLFGND